MHRFIEGRAFLKWHNPADLKSAAGAAEAKALLRKFAAHPGGTITFEYDELVMFRSNGTPIEVIRHLDLIDPQWSVAAPFHVEVDSVSGSCPPLPDGEDG
jgi:hypothetical protein